MARFTSIGMGRKKFVQSAAEEAQTHDSAGNEAGPSSIPNTSEQGEGIAGGIEKKKKRRGRQRVKDETGKRIAIGEKKGPDAKKNSWGKDEGISRRAKLSAKHAEERKQKRNEQKNANVTCFACRGVGHASRDCPNVLLGAAGEDGENSGMKRKGGKAGSQVTGGGKCYRCNSNEHSLHGCPEPIDSSNPTPFATCYICLKSGHLASSCASNGGKGIYVNGGECKVCKSVEHRAKDCPDDPRRQSSSYNENDNEEGGKRKRGEIILGVGQGAGADEDDFMVESRHSLSSAGVGDKGGKRNNKKHLPARNSERPMKRLRQVDEETGNLGERLEGGYQGPPEGERPGQKEIEQERQAKLPLTARKSLGVQQQKPKPKVVSF
ncbi:uncharacterized protein L201_004695 [Kwoniella dendrophila CBS 6074]|uniref:CCHC-type domain-containing protein n=1 Tax=Kwoniella dendrophila CBS 6074 TaxID=1295534 RepID=A0AAX4JY34_9TREE